jgi:cytochrome c peroxidase
LALLLACTASEDAAYDWGLPEGVAPPSVPDDNPQTAAKVEVGRLLFYDLRLSDGEQRACGTFTDGFPRALGAHGDLHPHNTLPIINVGYRSTLTWARLDLYDLEEQLLVPLLGTEPVEMGMADRIDVIEDLLRDDADYIDAMPAAFPDEADPTTLEHAAKAIAAFERSVISVDSPWDRFRRGDAAALSESAERGRRLFFGARAQCYRCHSGPELNQPAVASGRVMAPVGFYNIGLYDVDGSGAYPEGGEGLMKVSGRPEDMGRYRTPTLRNVEFSGPYMHDGSSATLRDIVDLLAAGGREVFSGPNVGDGRANPYKDPLIAGFSATDAERDDLVSFLLALSDPAFIADERFADPRPEEPDDTGQ